MASASGALSRAEGGAHSPSSEEHRISSKCAILRIDPGSVWRTGVTGHGLPQGKISPGDNILGHFLPQREYPRKYSPGGEYFLGQTLPPQGKISPM